MFQTSIRNLCSEDFPALLHYWQSLSQHTRSRFGPHPDDPETLQSICSGQNEKLLSYAGFHEESIVAYAVIHLGYLDFEIPRFNQYALTMNPTTDYTLAPSVADAYQGKGLGSKLLSYIIEDLTQRGGDKIVLWGGVQSTNLAAIRLYEKFAFQPLGQFEHNGTNLDMVRFL